MQAYQTVFPRAGPRADADGRVVEAISEDRRMIGLAVAVAVLDPTDAVVLDAVSLKLRLTEIFAEHRHTVIHRPARQVGVEPVHVAPRIGHARAMAERLGHVEASLMVHRERDGVRQQRLRREQLDRKPLRHPKLSDRPLPLVRGRLDLGFIGRVSLLSVRRGRKGPGEDQSRQGHRKDAGKFSQHGINNPGRYFQNSTDTAKRPACRSGRNLHEL